MHKEKSKKCVTAGIIVIFSVLLMFACASCSTILTYPGTGATAGGAGNAKPVTSRNLLGDRSLGDESVDWEEGYITAAGRSPVKNTGSQSYDLITAEKAARTLAYERLAEIISGINIDSYRNVSMEMLADSVLNGRVNAFIRGARIVGSDYKTYPDGSGYVEVRLKVSMNGADGLRDITAETTQRMPPGPLPEIFIPSGNGTLPPPVTDGTNPGTSVDIRRNNPGDTDGETVAELIGTTGLIVDASGLGAKPAMSPRILAPDERVIYGLLIVDESYVIQNGIVSYAHGMDEAKKMKRAGLNPLVIRATAVSGPMQADLVVSESDAEKIAAENKLHGFLKKCNVVIVID